MESTPGRRGAQRPASSGGGLRLADALSGIGVLVNIGFPTALQVRGEVEAAPWPLQVVLWTAFLVTRLDPVQRWFGGGSLEARNGRRTALGCVVATAAVCAAGVPELTAAACGLVIAVHLQWQHRRALVAGAATTAGLVALTAVAEWTGYLAHATGDLAPWFSLGAFGYAISTVANLAFIAGQQRTSQVQLASEQLLREELLRRIADQDALTGVLSRHALTQRLEAAAAAAAPGRGVGVLFCDVDRFKAVNDHHGHAVGDALLVEVATRLTTSTRAGSLVGRTGGDEFVVLLDGLADPEHVHQLAERVRRALAAPFVVEGRLLETGVSVGAAAVDEPTEAAVLVALADGAMYAEKAVHAVRGAHRPV